MKKEGHKSLFFSISFIITGYSWHLKSEPQYDFSSQLSLLWHSLVEILIPHPIIRINRIMPNIIAACTFFVHLTLKNRDVLKI